MEHIKSAYLYRQFLQVPRGLSYVRYISGNMREGLCHSDCHETWVRFGLDNRPGETVYFSFFQKICKILNVKKVQTSAYHPQANGMVERLHKSLHDGLSHYIGAAGTNWNMVVPFFLIAYRATPHSVTKFSLFYLLHGREMNVPTAESLKAQISSEVSDPNVVQWLTNLKSNLTKAYKTVHLNSERPHQQNKSYDDQKARQRNFEVNDTVYLFCSAKKARVSQKFRCVWKRPYKILNCQT
jgi:hypothetical protein